MLEVKNISKSYGSRQIIKDISINITKGEVVGFLGPNGSGKTTSFNIIAGMAYPDKGKVFFDNKDITPLQMYQRAKLGISYLPQVPSIFYNLSVYDNVMAVVELQPVAKSERGNIVLKLLEDFKISHLVSSKAKSLSGGERRRLEIARTLATNPKLILLDEPFVGIDPITISEIKQMISDLSKKGICVLITDHTVQETLSIVDNCYVIFQGEILCHGDKDKILNDAHVQKFYLGSSY